MTSEDYMLLFFLIIIFVIIWFIYSIVFFFRVMRIVKNIDILLDKKVSNELLKKIP